MASTYTPVGELELERGVWRCLAPGVVGLVFRSALADTRWRVPVSYRVPEDARPAPGCQG